MRKVWVARLAACAALSAAALLGLLASAENGHAEDRRPNILLIVADDAGFADLGSYGGEIQTPNLDALAAVGVRFSQFTVSATCSPTRSMLLSGVDNHVAGLGNMAEFTAPNQKGKKGYEGHLNDRVVAFPELLKGSGYHTYMAGKWHMGEESRHWPAARGFERDLTLIPGGGSHFDDMWGAKGERQLYTRNGKPLGELRPGFHSSEDYASAIIENIEENRADGKPFFAYLALQAPHDPFQLPDEWLDRYKGRYDQGYDATRAARIERMKMLGLIRDKATIFPRLPNVPSWDSLTAEQRQQSARRMELYAAMVENMDAHVGRLVAYLKARRLYDNTLIVFLSDNGAEGNQMNMGPPWNNNVLADWGKKGTFIQYGPAWAQVGVGPFRMFKGFVSEGGIRAPLIVAGRNLRGSGRISSTFVHVKDISATILDAAGVAYPGRHDGRMIAPLEGKSLLPILDGTRASVRNASDWVGWELFGNRAIRQGDWKLLWLCEPAGPSQWQLFNLAVDPGETRDLSATRPARKERMLRLWRQYATESNVILPDRSPACPQKN